MLCVFSELTFDILYDLYKNLWIIYKAEDMNSNALQFSLYQIFSRNSTKTANIFRYSGKLVRYENVCRLESF